MDLKEKRKKKKKTPQLPDMCVFALVKTQIMLGTGLEKKKILKILKKSRAKSSQIKRCRVNNSRQFYTSESTSPATRMDPLNELRKQTFTAQGRVQKVKRRGEVMRQSDKGCTTEERGLRAKGELALEASYSCR